MFPIFQYIRFLLTSTNQHGVHSPFVFQYLTNCLYKNSRTHSRKAVDVMLKSIPYFGIRQVYLAGDDEALHEILLKTHPGLNFGPPPFDLVYLPAPDPVFLAREGPDPLPWHNDTLCVLDRIHLSHQNTECWEKVKSLPQVRVTIDAFHCGLVFFRREQAEQHFKIRI